LSPVSQQLYSNCRTSTALAALLQHLPHFYSTCRTSTALAALLQHLPHFYSTCRTSTAVHLIGSGIRVTEPLAWQCHRLKRDRLPVGQCLRLASASTALLQRLYSASTVPFKRLYSACTALVQCLFSTSTALLQRFSTLLQRLRRGATPCWPGSVSD
jgi:hypothetical protein